MDVESKLNELEKRVAALESGKSDKTGDDADIFSFVKLDEPWANATVRRDPKIWTGDSMVGKTYSECSAEYLEKLAGYFAFLARKGAEDPQPKVDSKGKPYFERDKFSAKLCRTWAAFKRSSEDPNW